MNAWELQQNQQGKIIQINDSPKEVIARLDDLGFSVNEILTCLKHPPFQGPRVYLNSHGVFSLEKEVARLIEVQVL